MLLKRALRRTDRSRFDTRIVGADGVSGNPALAWYQQQVAVSDAAVSVEKAHRLPDFSVGYLNQSLTTPEGSDPRYNSADRFHVVQAGVSVPIFGKAQKARIESAQLERQVNEINPVRTDVLHAVHPVDRITCPYCQHFILQSQEDDWPTFSDLFAVNGSHGSEGQWRY